MDVPCHFFLALVSVMRREIVQTALISHHHGVIVFGSQPLEINGISNVEPSEWLR
jgi:hypothetical protein